MSHSIRDMASLLGVSKSQVQRDKAAGMPMHDAEAARAWRRAHHDMSRTVEGRIDRPGAPTNTPRAAAGGLASAAGAGGGNTPPADPDGDDEAPAAGDTEEYRRHRTDRERIKVQREQLELDRQLGRVIDLQEAQRLAFTSFRTLRDRGMNLPSRVKDQCAAMTDATQIETLLEAELAAVFEVDPQSLLADADADDDDEAQ